MLLLLEHLDRGRFSPVVLCPAEGGVSRQVRRLGIEVASLNAGMSFDGVSAGRYAPSVRRLARRLGVEVVHCDTIYTALMCGLALVGTRVPLIFHARTSERARLLDGVVPAGCARIICVSEAATKRFPRRWASRVCVVPNGVDVSRFRPGLDGGVLRQQLGIPAEAFVIGYCGQLIREKGLFALVEAVSRLQTEAQPIVLFLAGKGPDEAALRRAAGCAGFFLSFADPRPEFYAALDAFVLPTLLQEGLSRALLEAMACGVPCVATPLGGNLEVVVPGETGLVVPAGDVAALCSALRQLRADPGLRARMAAEGRRRVEDHFDHAATVRGVMDVYERVRA